MAGKPRAGASRSGGRRVLSSDARSRWERTYAETPYRQLPWFSPHPSPWVRACVAGRRFAPRVRVLDVGCGAGSNALYLARSGFRAAGVDLAPAAIAAASGRAERAGLKVDFRVSDALDLPFGRATFGALLDMGCFHTLPTNLRRAYSKELARVLRPGGRFALSWLGREDRGTPGPPHRPSLEETTAAFEEEFLFLETRFGAVRRRGRPGYSALLERRARPRPAPM